MITFEGWGVDDAKLVEDFLRRYLIWMELGMGDMDGEWVI